MEEHAEVVGAAVVASFVCPAEGSLGAHLVSSLAQRDSEVVRPDATTAFVGAARGFLGTRQVAPTFEEG